MRTIIIYKSKYGSTKKYAEWIAERTWADMVETPKLDVDALQSYDNIVFGGYLHATGIAGLDVIKKNWDEIKDKNIVIFTVGLASINDGTYKDIVRASFSEDEMKKIKLFGLRGAFDYEKLGRIDKAMMYMMKMDLKSKDYSSLNDDEKGLLKAYNEPVDFIDPASIEPVVDTITSS